MQPYGNQDRCFVRRLEVVAGLLELPAKPVLEMKLFVLGAFAHDQLALPNCKDALLEYSLSGHISFRLIHWVKLLKGGSIRVNYAGM